MAKLPPPVVTLNEHFPPITAADRAAKDVNFGRRILTEYVHHRPPPIPFDAVFDIKSRAEFIAHLRDSPPPPPVAEVPAAHWPASSEIRGTFSNDVADASTLSFDDIRANVEKQIAYLSGRRHGKTALQQAAVDDYAAKVRREIDERIGAALGAKIEWPRPYTARVNFPLQAMNASVIHDHVYMVAAATPTCARCDLPRHEGRPLLRHPVDGQGFLCGDCMAGGVPLADQPAKPEPPPLERYHAWETPAWDGVG